MAYWALEAVEWAVAQGLLAGRSTGSTQTLAPLGTRYPGRVLRRAQDAVRDRPAQAVTKSLSPHIPADETAGIVFYLPLILLGLKSGIFVQTIHTLRIQRFPRPLLFGAAPRKETSMTHALFSPAAGSTLPGRRVQSAGPSAIRNERATDYVLLLFWVR